MTFVSKKDMGRVSTFTEEQVSEAAYFFFAESNEKANVENIAKRVGIERTALQNHYSYDDLHSLAVKEAFKRLTMNTFGIFADANKTFEEKITHLVVDFIKKAEKSPQLGTFLMKEISGVDRKVVGNHIYYMQAQFEPFEDEVDKQIELGAIIDIEPIQLLMHIISLSSYPVIAKPIIHITAGRSLRDYNIVIQKYQNEIVRFILKGLEK